MPDPNTRIAIIGATGVVGREALAILEARRHPAHNIILFASARSAGERIAYEDSSLACRSLDEAKFDDVDAVLLCAGADIARAIAPIAIQQGAIVIDNSSAFRLEPEVPLVIPEINGEALRASEPPRLIANPNCSTIILLTALNLIRAQFGLRRVILSTYQAVSGAGRPGLDELRAQIDAASNSEAPSPSFFREPIALNVFSHESAVDPASGRNGEDQKIIDESRRIWGNAQLTIIPTCIRVPVERAHSQSVTVELDAPAQLADVHSVLSGTPGVRFDPSLEGPFPTPQKASGEDDILVGRPRLECERWLSLWICGDQLRKGAALNAIQILDHMSVDALNHREAALAHHH